MNHQKRIRTAIILSSALVSMVFLEYYWQRISVLATPIGILIILILSFIVFIKFISTTITILRNRKGLVFRTIIPSVVYLLSLILIVYQPDFLNPYNYQGAVKYRGCYEGTVNTGTILFRETGKFEYKHIGFFGSTIFETGKWHQDGDTLLLNFDGEVPELIGSKMLMTKKRFTKIQGDSLTSKRFSFYRGFCKGLN